MLYGLAGREREEKVEALIDFRSEGTTGYPLRPAFHGLKQGFLWQI
jgi:hypothetical protein